MSCAALSAIVPGDPRREPFDLDGPCALKREAGSRARQEKKDTLTRKHAHCWEINQRAKNARGKKRVVAGVRRGRFRG